MRSTLNANDDFSLLRFAILIRSAALVSRRAHAQSLNLLFLASEGTTAVENGWPTVFCALHSARARASTQSLCSQRKLRARFDCSTPLQSHVRIQFESIIHGDTSVCPLSPSLTTDERATSDPAVREEGTKKRVSAFVIVSLEGIHGSLVSSFAGLACFSPGSPASRWATAAPLPSLRDIR
ncbi:hypothetical protein BDZ90DRAFT_230239 [Jaminaea rosea]|uniref:Uncharacterized protein n=1 Tax=Jaminaea rosea TaxID=1569628 RepID=A0A316UVN0_9BASI|nr:hypothetical protein BDZ90DRAFT_230239 [Jaminaea rosea]PWN29357.1 hypothetical protein BDZ90DRAFT_230239 [Jaminaea rosea]